jgi:hypothetical protein
MLVVRPERERLQSRAMEIQNCNRHAQQCATHRVSASSCHHCGCLLVSTQGCAQRQIFSP